MSAAIGVSPVGGDTVVRQPAKAGDAEMGSGLEAIGLGLRLGSTQALSDVRFRLCPGETVAVVGPSGSGKSSLLHCLGCIVAPSAGEIRLNDRRVDDLPDRVLSACRRRAFGFVFQFAELLPEIDLASNVALPLRFGQATRRVARARAVDVMERLGIGDLGRRRPSEVSGGQLQRAAVARAIVHEPGFVLADEPTGALDRASGELVLSALFDPAVRGQSSLLIVSHDDAVADRADRIVRIEDGQLLAPSSVM